MLLLLVVLVASLGAGDLRRLDTRYYRLHSDLPPGLTQTLGRELDAMYDEYARRFAGFGDAGSGADERLDVHLFADRDDYVGFVGNVNRHSGGVYIPGRRVLASYLGDRGRDELRAVLRHEAFHQFADVAVGEQVPPWLNEGLAQLFEDGHWQVGPGGSGARFVMGGVTPHRLRRWQADRRRGTLPTLAGLVAMDHDAWHANMPDAHAAGSQYNAAWAAAHFFVYATDGEGSPLLRDRLVYMLRLLHAGYDPAEAFRRSVGDPADPTGTMDRALNLYVGTLRPGEVALAREAQEVRADMLEHLHDQGWRPATMAEFRQHVVRAGYRIEYDSDSVRWLTAEDPSVYFADPLGRELPASMLHFANGDGRVGAAGRPLPDMVCRTSSGVTIRTRFIAAGGELDTETTVTPR